VQTNLYLFVCTIHNLERMLRVCVCVGLIPHGINQMNDRLYIYGLFTFHGFKGLIVYLIHQSHILKRKCLYMHCTFQ